MPKSKQYEQKFRKEWLRDSILKDWVVPFESDKTRAYCKYCRREIRAKYQDLKSHAASKRHKFSLPAKTTVQFDKNDDIDESFDELTVTTEHISSSTNNHYKSPKKSNSRRHSSSDNDDIDEYDDTFDEMTVITNHRSSSTNNHYKSRKKSNSRRHSLSDDEIFAQLSQPIRQKLSHIYKQIKMDQSEEYIDLMPKSYSSPAPPTDYAPTNSYSEKESGIDHLTMFGNYVSFELQRIDSLYAKQLAKSKISSIIFEATTGMYNRKNVNSTRSFI